MRYWLLVMVMLVGCDDTIDGSTDMDPGGGAGGVIGEGGAGGDGAAGGAGGMGGGVGGAGGMGGAGAMGGAGGMPPPPERLAECGYGDRYIASNAVRDGEGCRAPGPEAGDLVVLDHATSVIRYGDVAATIVDIDANCGLRAVTCTADAEAGDFETLTITLADGALRIERAAISGGSVVDCSPATATLAAAPACQVDGRYRVDAAELTSGMCDHPWAAGEVQIGDVAGGSRRIRWLEEDVNYFRFSAVIEREIEGECAVEAGGTYVIAGASRVQSMRAQADGDQLTLVIAESQDGPDEDNNLCPEATFMATGSRVVPSAQPGMTRCEAPGAICGDGMCTADIEDCRTCADDCGCGDGTCGRVGETYLCGAPCVDGECPAGQRCLVEFPAFEGPTCLPDDGRAAPGGDCASSLDCATGLVCSCTLNWDCPNGSVCVEACADDCDRCDTRRWGTEVCERDCSPDDPACAGGTACVTRSTNTGCTRAMGVDPWICYPRETAHACEPGVPPAFGELCGAGRRCAAGLECVGTTCEQLEEGVGCEVYQCSQGCIDASDCEAPLAECWRVENRDFGYCIAPQQ